MLEAMHLNSRKGKGFSPSLTPSPPPPPNNINK